MSIIALLPLAELAIKRLWPDKDQAEKVRLQLFEMEQQGQMAELEATVKLLLAQAEINVEEAKSKSVFVAGWRPFVGWVCASALAWNFIVYPTVMWAGVDAPGIDMAELMVVLLGMLGIGGMRSFDKKHKVSTETL